MVQLGPCFQNPLSAQCWVRKSPKRNQPKVGKAERGGGSCHPVVTPAGLTGGPAGTVPPECQPTVPRPIPDRRQQPRTLVQQSLQGPVIQGAPPPPVWKPECHRRCDHQLSPLSPHWELPAPKTNPSPECQGTHTFAFLWFSSQIPEHTCTHTHSHITYLLHICSVFYGFELTNGIILLTSLTFRFFDIAVIQVDASSP